MSGEIPPVVQHCYDLDALDAVIGRMCHTEQERAAVKRVLGVDRQEQAATDAYTPDRPPLPDVRAAFDHAARTRAAIDRYAAWVGAYPDDDPTPLLERQRVLRIAQRNLQRLEGGL